MLEFHSSTLYKSPSFSCCRFDSLFLVFLFFPSPDEFFSFSSSVRERFIEIIIKKGGRRTEGDRVDHHLSRFVRVMVFDTRLAISSESAITICLGILSRGNF